MWNPVRACSSLDATVGLTDQGPRTQVTFTITTERGTTELASTGIGDAATIQANLNGGRHVYRRRSKTGRFRRLKSERLSGV
jgi:hypothetical protein